jgi:hypothetical protein
MKIVRGSQRSRGSVPPQGSVCIPRAPPSPVPAGRGPAVPCPAGLNQILQCPGQSPGFSAQPVSQAPLYSSRSVQRSSHLPVCGSCRPDLLHGPQNYKAGPGAEGGAECINISLFCLNKLELNKMQNY